MTNEVTLMVVDIETRQLTGDKPLKEQSLNEMDALARGVEMRLGLPQSSMTVILATVEVAQHLRTPKGEIQCWVAARSGRLPGSASLKRLLSPFSI